jgi:hypothetical protein
MIRIKVREQVGSISKEILAVSCRMAEFETFYAYFNWFIAMAQEGETNRRLTKKHMQLLADPSQSHSLL